MQLDEEVTKIEIEKVLKSVTKTTELQLLDVPSKIPSEDTLLDLKVPPTDVVTPTLPKDTVTIFDTPKDEVTPPNPPGN